MNVKQNMKSINKTLSSYFIKFMCISNCYEINPIRIQSVSSVDCWQNAVQFLTGACFSAKIVFMGSIKNQNVQYTIRYPNNTKWN